MGLGVGVGVGVGVGLGVGLGLGLGVGIGVGVRVRVRVRVRVWWASHTSQEVDCWLLWYFPAAHLVQRWRSARVGALLGLGVGVGVGVGVGSQVCVADLSWGLPA